MNNIQSALDWAIEELQHVDAPASEARILLCYCLACEPVYVLTWPDEPLTPSQTEQFQRLISQRKAGQPVAYILGYRDFWTLRLKVCADTLIPRAETELLVEQALALNLPDNANVLDLGTGTGAIALALASERPGWKISAVDFKPEVVALARQNAIDNQLERVNILQSNWFSALSGQKFDLIVSNPPYVEQDSHWLKKGDVRFEPLSALISGNDGLDDIRFIAQQVRQYLKRDGILMLEHGYQQQLSVHKVLESNELSGIKCLKDLAGLARVTVTYNR